MDNQISYFDEFGFQKDLVNIKVLEICEESQDMTTKVIISKESEITKILDNFVKDNND